MADLLAPSDLSESSEEFLTEDEDESSGEEDLTPRFGGLTLGGNDDEDVEDDDYDSDEEGPLYPTPAVQSLLSRKRVIEVPPAFASFGVPAPTQRATTGGRTIMAPPVAAPLAIPLPPAQRAPSTVVVPPPPVQRLQLNVQPATGAVQVPPPPVPVGPSPVGPIPVGPTPVTLVVPVVPPPTVPRVSPEELTRKLVGITIEGVTPAANLVAPDINDLLHKEADESEDDFEARRRLTLRLANIENYKLNNSTAVVLGHMMMRKSRLGIKYDTDIEAGINQVLKLVE
jgi:hypothetical protein